jgi:L-ascorbate metabolism protein UlaG (beta-lactamase superfamily)
MTPHSSEAGVSTTGVRISWLGHAMFMLEDEAGNRLVTDPYDSHVGYALPDVEADIVLVSHGHGDHSNAGLIKGNPLIISDPAPKEVKGIPVRGFPSFHDSHNGAERGPNIIFKFTMQDLAFVHLGDLGHTIEGSLLKELSGIDVLFVPVGGVFTIEDSQAEQVVKALSSRIAIPMHYRTKACPWAIQTEEPFAQRFEHVERVGKQPLFVSRETLPDTTRIVILDYVS